MKISIIASFSTNLNRRLLIVYSNLNEISDVGLEALINTIGELEQLINITLHFSG